MLRVKIWISTSYLLTAHCLPLTAYRLPVFARDGPAFVVAPAPADLEVARRVTLALEAGAADEREGGGVAGLDVGLDAVELEAGEGVAEHEPQALGHVAAPGVGLARVVAHVSAAEVAVDDLVEVERADDAVVLCAAGEEPHGLRDVAPFEESGELLRLLRGRDPSPVQAHARAHQRY